MPFKDGIFGGVLNQMLLIGSKQVQVEILPRYFDFAQCKLLRVNSRLTP